MVILSDLSEVLIRGNQQLGQLISFAYGNGVSEQLTRRHFQINDVFCDLMRGKYEEKYYWDLMVQGQNLPLSGTDLMCFFIINIGIVIPGTADVYRRIKSYPETHRPHDARGTGRPPIYLVSDHIPGYPVRIASLHPFLRELTDKQFWSFERGQLKQDPGFFDSLLSDTGLHPDEVLFVDDNPDNIAAAAKSGIQGIVFENAAQLEYTMTRDFGFEFFYSP